MSRGVIDYPIAKDAGEDPEFKSYFPHSIFATVIFFPFGIVALAYSRRAAEAHRFGYHDQAHRFAEQAAAWGMAAIAVLPIAVVVVMAAVALSR